MSKRLRTAGLALMAFGLVLVLAGGWSYLQVKAGYDSFGAISSEQDVTLSYNDEGQLTDRGTTEGAEAIMTLLTEDWKYPVVDGDFDPADPVVNTASEYMFQMATITYHILHGTQIVVLTEDAEYQGEVFPAGTYEVPVDGRYWTDFNRSHPLEGPAREQAWSGTAHGLTAELGVGAVTHNVLQMGLGISAAVALTGLMGLLGGAGLVWASKADVMGDVLRRMETEKPLDDTLGTKESVEA
jgi:hypothetical protein